MSACRPHGRAGAHDKPVTTSHPEPAQRVGQPVPAGHMPDQVRGVDAGHPGGSDEQRARTDSAHDRHRVGSGAEPGLGYSDHRDAELGVRSRAHSACPGSHGRRRPHLPANAEDDRRARRSGRCHGRDGRAHAGVTGPPGLLNPVPAQRARLLLAQARPGAANRTEAVARARELSLIP